jgi:hypothetical protein
MSTVFPGELFRRGIWLEKETQMDGPRETGVDGEAEPLEMTLDDMIHRHDVQHVLEALAVACEFEDDQARDAWEGPEGRFDPAWLRLATRVRRIASSGDLPKGGVA